MNLGKHGIDFEDAIGIFEGPVFVKRSDRDGEERFVAVGEVEGRVVAVAYTIRGDSYRIISARRGRKNEQRDYYDRKAAPGG
ncbi:MAG: BrnT family toxin [Gemmatimonadota bacterium]|nr:BrnT family toxin [Gemmatimonadota bacterium]